MGEDGSIIGSTKLNVSHKRRREMLQELEAYQAKNQNLTLLVPSSKKQRRRNLTHTDVNDFAEEVASVMGLTPRSKASEMKLPKIRAHVEDASKLLANQPPSSMSKKEFLKNLHSVSSNRLKSEDKPKEDSFETPENLYRSNPISRHKLNRGRRKTLKNIHDKFNTAIRLDQNWGVSSKVATGIVTEIKRKHIDINYRKIRYEFFLNRD